MVQLHPTASLTRLPPQPKRPLRGTAGFLEQAAAAAPLLTAEEEEELVARWQRNGDKRAHDRLIRSHLRLVLKVASRYRRQREGMEDLVQEGVIGLERALNGYKLGQGARLATYAVWWIRSSIQEAVYRTDSIVRAPRTNERFQRFFKSGPVADDHPVDLDLDRPIGGAGSEDAATFIELLADERETPEAAVARGEIEAATRTALTAAIASLDERERRILLSRHVGAKQETLTELGGALGVSAERVRQLETRALSKMRGQLGRLRAPALLFS